MHRSSVKPHTKHIKYKSYVKFSINLKLNNWNQSIKTTKRPIRNKLKKLVSLQINVQMLRLMLKFS